jgi:tRNA dimethylallyltransferase
MDDMYDITVGPDMMSYDMLVVTGPTASGKTALAATIAHRLGGEVISADSRQIYRKMNLGTGKDYNDYIVDGKPVPYHLIDIADPGYKYNVFEYQRDFTATLLGMRSRGAFPVVCGGSGMYIDAIVSGYRMFEVPPDPEFRASLEDKSLSELAGILSSYKKLHNITDLDTRKRAIRAIEIERFNEMHRGKQSASPEVRPLVTGILYSREERRERISARLRQRLSEGMIDEVKQMLDEGISPESLIYYGLEYKYLTLYLTGRLTYDNMFRALETAIHQFAKRQMTWFRGMERRGVKIHWINGELPFEQKVDYVLKLLFQISVEPFKEFPLPDD